MDLRFFTGYNVELSNKYPQVKYLTLVKYSDKIKA